MKKVDEILESISGRNFELSDYSSGKIDDIEINRKWDLNIAAAKSQLWEEIKPFIKAGTNLLNEYDSPAPDFVLRRKYKEDLRKNIANLSELFGEG